MKTKTLEQVAKEYEEHHAKYSKKMRDYSERGRLIGAKRKMANKYFDNRYKE